MSSLLSKIKKNSVIKGAEVINKSSHFQDEFCSTGICALDIILSARAVDGGFSPGLLILGAPKAHFKSALAFNMIASYLKKHEDSVCIFYDSEHGVSLEGLNSMGVDTDRVVHIPIASIEDIKQDMTNQLANIETGEKVIFLIDSLGMLASTKEAKDALEGKVSVDMTKAKELGSLARLITPPLAQKKLTCIAINHVYQDISSMYGGKINSGGEKLQYAASSIVHISKSQIKDGTDLEGFKFTLIADKSRYVREKMRIPLNVTFDKGIHKWSGLFDLALTLGWIIAPKQGWYMAVDKNTGEELLPSNVRRAAIENDDAFWEKMFDKGFSEDIYQTYSLTGNKINKNLIEGNVALSQEVSQDEGEE